MMADAIVPAADASLPLRSRSDGAIAYEIDRDVFSIEAVLRAAYKFTDRCHLFIQTHDTRSGHWLVVMRPKTDAHVPQDLAGDFANELIDQRLRQSLEQQFGDIRTLIVAQAFAEGNLLDADADDDYIKDPLEIGRLRP